MSLNAKIKKYHEEGLTVSEIVKKLQEEGLKVRYQRVYNVLLPFGPRTNGRAPGREGISKKIEEMLNEGKTIKEICIALQVYPAQVYQVKKRINQGLKEEDAEG
jgi:sugar-specific transcriptional regulator TrmB